MSLLQSIFGDVTTAGDASKPKKKNAALTTLFDKTPEPDVKKVEDDDASEDESSSSDSDDSSTSSSSSNNESGKDEKESKPDDKVDEEVAVEKEEKKPRKKRKEKKETVEEENKETKADSKDTDKTANKKDEEEDHTIFVGNLPLSITRKSLAKLFQEVGKVKSARLRSVAVTGVKVPQNHAGNQSLVKKVCTNTKQIDVGAKSSLQGYVVFAEKESVAKAIATFNNRPLPDESPKATRAIRRIRVDTATPTLDPKRSVFVGGLPYQADEASLQDHFVRGCGLEVSNVQGVRIVRDKETFQCKGIGYVIFEDSTMVATALQRMHESTYMRRVLRVKVCGKSIKGRRGEPKRKETDSRQPQPYESPFKKARRAAAEGGARPADEAPAAGAMRRVAGSRKNKRVRGEKKKDKPGINNKPGVSKRAASEAKAEKRAKQLQKRLTKGMGKKRKA